MYESLIDFMAISQTNPPIQNLSFFTSLQHIPGIHPHPRRLTRKSCRVVLKGWKYIRI